MPTSTFDHHSKLNRLTGLIELHYLPCIAYFSALTQLRTVKLERCEHYVKQTYRSRCQVLSAQGPLRLIVPLTFKHRNVYITDIRVDHSQKWVNNHWRTIRSAYGKAPFFEHYGEDLEKILYSRKTFLYDLNLELLSMCLSWLGLSVVLEETLAYEKEPAPDVLDLRSAIGAKNPQKVQYFYKPVSYQQVFGSTFADNLSLIDLVFCTGPDALTIVRASGSRK
jgi:hypothetical protein